MSSIEHRSIQLLEALLPSDCAPLLSSLQSLASVTPRANRSRSSTAPRGNPLRSRSGTSADSSPSGGSRRGTVDGSPIGVTRRDTRSDVPVGSPPGPTTPLAVTEPIVLAPTLAETPSGPLLMALCRAIAGAGALRGGTGTRERSSEAASSLSDDEAGDGTTPPPPQSSSLSASGGSGAGVGAVLSLCQHIGVPGGGLHWDCPLWEVAAVGCDAPRLALPLPKAQGSGNRSESGDTSTPRALLLSFWSPEIADRVALGRLQAIGIPSFREEASSDAIDGDGWSLDDRLLHRVASEGVRRLVYTRVSLRRQPRLPALLRVGASPEALDQFFKEHPRQILVRWVNFHVAKVAPRLAPALAPKLRVHSLSGHDFADGLVMCALIASLGASALTGASAARAAGALVAQSLGATDSHDAVEERVRVALQAAQVLAQGVGGTLYPLDAETVLQGEDSERELELWVATLFDALPGLPALPPALARSCDAFRDMLTSDEWAGYLADQQSILRWVQASGLHHPARDAEVVSLGETVADGILPLQLLSNVLPVDLARVHVNECLTDDERADNCQLLLDLLTEHEVFFPTMDLDELIAGSEHEAFEVMSAVRRLVCLHAAGVPFDGDLMLVDWANERVRQVHAGLDEAEDGPPPPVLTSFRDVKDESFGRFWIMLFTSLYSDAAAVDRQRDWTRAMNEALYSDAPSLAAFLVSLAGRGAGVPLFGEPWHLLGDHARPRIVMYTIAEAMSVAKAMQV